MDTHFSAPIWILRMLDGVRTTATIRSALELDLFAALDNGPLDAAAVAQRIRCPKRSTQMLLEALVALDLLDKDRTTAAFRLMPEAQKYLVPGKPDYAGGFAWIVANPLMWTGFSRLTDAIRNDGSVLSEHAETASHPFWTTFAKSSDAFSRPIAEMTEEILRERILATQPTCRVLDLGAGSGIYGFTLAARHPHVHVTALDWPNVLPAIQQQAVRMCISPARVRCVAGDLREVDYGGDYDLVVVSHVHHHFDRATCAAITQRIGSVLGPGGHVVVHEFLGDPRSKSGAMFNITMLAWTPRGEAYSTEDYRTWFDAAGIELVDKRPCIGIPSHVLVGRKRDATNQEGW